jgi:ketosteroid isomerase-like protein
MDEAGVQRWLDAYLDAWRTYDPAAIGELFSEDAEYRYHPWDEPVIGRAAIVGAWLGDQDEPGSWSAEYRPWLVSGENAVAVGVSRYVAEDGQTVEREYHNVFLCRFDGDGRCREFTELFLLRKD